MILKKFFVGFISSDKILDSIGIKGLRKKERIKKEKKERKIFKGSIQWLLLIRWRLLIVTNYYTYTRIGVFASYRYLCVEGRSHSYSVLDF